MMRKTVYIAGVLFSSITLLSILFKLLHLQGAQILLIIGIVGLALLFIPLYAIYRYNKDKRK
ncbi:GldL-related protein [Aureibaculum sp. 2210JD6-5]|uniref:GldL-related protein n=1 Tax=Aureibaculum sp. 2210JD6-5 TaxID=3103957 RepID=UPI0039F1D8DD